MGFRLNCETKDGRLCFYGTKLYGYCGEEMFKLRSYRYLKRLKIEVPLGCYCYTSDQELSAKQFKKFIKLYNKDFDRVVPLENRNYKPLDFLNNEEIKALIETKEPILIHWG